MVPVVDRLFRSLMVRFHRSYLCIRWEGMVLTVQHDFPFPDTLTMVLFHVVEGTPW